MGTIGTKAAFVPIPMRGISMTTKKIKADVVIALLLLALGVILWFNVAAAPAQARSYPRFMILLTGIPVLVILLRPFVAKNKDKYADLTLKVHPRVLAVILGTILYIVLIKITGYYVTTFFFIAGVMVFLGARNKLSIIGTALIMTVFVYIMFSRILLISLPQGLLF